MQALELLHWSGRGFHAVIVGAGNALSGLQDLVEMLRLTDDVTFTGLVSDEELVQLHRIGDVYVMPSPAELQCLAMLEAMASGKAVVAVDAGALGELCHNGKNGYLIRVDDIEAMAKALTDLQIIQNDVKNLQKKVWLLQVNMMFGLLFRNLKNCTPTLSQKITNLCS